MVLVDAVKLEISNLGGKMKTTKQVLLLLLFPALVMLLACSSNMQWTSPPPMSIDQSKEYEATIKTNFGDIEVQLFPEEAPLAVNNFVFLARQTG